MNTTIQKRIKSDKILNLITQKTDNQIFIVGGTVRDYILNVETHDRDLIVTDEEAESFSLKLSKILNATFVPLDVENKIYRLVMPDKINYLDITNPIENSLQKDLLRRDISINAIAVNIRNYEIIDYANGLFDIEKRIINSIDEHNFYDDPLRILRVFRFKAIYGFEISQKTYSEIKKYINLINNPSVERINYELLKLFAGKYTVEALKDMDKINLLEKIFPFVFELKKVPPNSHHHLNLFEHSLETVNQVQILYEKSDKNIKEHLETISFGGHPNLAYLKLSAFMHDIGKYSTWTIEEGGRHRFIKHDDVGSKLAKNLLKQMHFSNKQTEYISLMIKNHIYPSSVMSAPEITDKIMMRYLRKMQDYSIDCIILAMADRLSARGPDITDKIVQNNIENLNKLLRFCIENYQSLKPLPKLLDGNDVIKILNIKPSPKLGEIIDALHEAQISGDIATVEDAINFVINYKNTSNNQT